MYLKRCSKVGDCATKSASRILSWFKVAEPHATVLVLIPEDLCVQVGAR